MTEQPLQAPSSRAKRSTIVTALRLFATMLASYAVVVLLAIWHEDWLVHRPSGADDWSPKPDQRIVDVTIDVPNPTMFDQSAATLPSRSIHGWWLPGNDFSENHVLLFLHGKSGNVSHRGAILIELQRQLGGSVLTIDYPGYGKSTGPLSEVGCYLAAESGYHWLVNTKHFQPTKITVFGESLGGGIAVDLASKHPWRRLIVVSSYTSMPNAAAARMWWLPCRWVMRNQFDSINKIARVTCPVVVAHGTSDDRIPFSHSELLFAKAPGPKRFIKLLGKAHNDYFHPEFFDSLRVLP